MSPKPTPRLEQMFPPSSYFWLERQAYVDVRVRDIQTLKNNDCKDLKSLIVPVWFHMQRLQTTQGLFIRHYVNRSPLMASYHWWELIGFSYSIHITLKVPINKIIHGWHRHVIKIFSCTLAVCLLPLQNTQKHLLFFLALIYDIFTAEVITNMIGPHCVQL